MSIFRLCIIHCLLLLLLLMLLLLLLHPFNDLFSRTTWGNQYQKGVLGCSGISLTICKQSAPRSRQTPSSLNFTGRMLFQTPNQQCQGTEGPYAYLIIINTLLYTINMQQHKPINPLAVSFQYCRFITNYNVNQSNQIISPDFRWDVCSPAASVKHLLLDTSAMS